MSVEIAIHLENVSKMYKIFDSRSHRLKEAVRIFGKSSVKEFWALKDINFQIPAGSTVGILGKNGSGKSTLLQLITAVLYPTTGKILVKGRVAALLELGSGFNPELTGRENVIMNGMVMGLTRAQISEKMELIEDFADIGEFFDQPMRIYSSGMFMRVAFAAAIHVDPDILIIDEALSVGDAKFQEKCFRRFRYFQEAGKTILLVTHDRSAVPRLCNLGLLLNQGQLIEIGAPKRIVNLYSNILATGDVAELGESESLTSSRYAIPDSMIQDSEPTIDDFEQSNITRSFIRESCSIDRCPNRLGYNKDEYRYGNNQAAIVDYLIFSQEGEIITAVQCGETINILLKVKFYKNIAKPLLGLSVRDVQGVLVFGLNSGWSNKIIPEVFSDQMCSYKISLQVNLRPGPWFLEFAVAASQSDLCDVRSNIVQLDVISGPVAFDGLVLLENDIEILA